MKINIFVYYGARINKIDYENLTRKLGIERLYEAVYSKGLTFRDVGEIGVGNNYVIGREIHWEMQDICKLVKINDNLFFDETKESISISDDEQDEIRQKLLEINITQKPEYCIFAGVDLTSNDIPRESIHYDIE